MHFQITVNCYKTELDERDGYNDETVDAVRDINASDKSFFRIRKNRGSGPGMLESLNDAMVFGYYGTSSYSSFNNLNYIKFLMAVGAMSESDLATDTRWSYALVEYPLLSTFARENMCSPTILSPFETAEYHTPAKISLPQPELPLGRAGYYITEDMPCNYPVAKPPALLHATVLKRDAAAELGPATNYGRYKVSGD